MNINRAVLVGRIVAPISVRKTSSGKNVCGLTLAVQNSKDYTSFIECTAWERIAEILAQYGKKGTLLGVEGKILQVKQKTKEGKNISKVIVNIDAIQLLGQVSSINNEEKIVSDELEWD